MGRDVALGQRVDQRLTALRIHVRRARESSSARGIRPQRERQSLQEMTDPAYAERLPSLDTRDRRLIAGDDGNTEIGPEEL